MPTKIEWAEETWNPITGCTPVSEGCEHCYARRMAQRLAGRYGYPKEDPFRPGVFHPDKLDLPYSWGRPRHVFVCSMGDLFHVGVTQEHINAVLNTVSNALRHRFLFLTKRPERMALGIAAWRKAEFEGRFSTGATMREQGANERMWLGVTAENQKRADERIPVLLKIPAAVRFVSLEPLLGPVDLREGRYWIDSRRQLAIDVGLGHLGADNPMLGFVIVGAETGPGARPMDLDWARQVRDQCQEAGVPFFFKKDSDGNRELDGRLWEERV